MKLSKTAKLFLKAYHHNWDQGVKALDRIVSNKDCDKATALLIYWLGQPAYYNQYDGLAAVPKQEQPVYQLLKKIEQLVTTGALKETLSFAPNPADIPTVLGQIPIEMTQASEGSVDAKDLIEQNIGELKLLKACREGKLAMVKTLLDREDLDVNQKIDGDLPIALAVIFGHFELVEFLISKGANLKVKTGPSGFTLHQWACQSGHTKISDLLCQHGLKIDAKGKWGRTALHDNVYWEEAKMITVLDHLLDQGANPALKDADGLDAFDLAQKAGNQAALERLNRT